MKTKSLKPCPCGAIPDELSITDGSTFRWRYVDGGCCGEWSIEVRVPTTADATPDNYDEYEWCCEAWNQVPRWCDE